MFPQDLLAGQQCLRGRTEWVERWLLNNLLDSHVSLSLWAGPKVRTDSPRAVIETCSCQSHRPLLTWNRGLTNRTESGSVPRYMPMTDVVIVLYLNSRPKTPRNLASVLPLDIVTF